MPLFLVKLSTTRGLVFALALLAVCLSGQEAAGLAYSYNQLQVIEELATPEALANPAVVDILETLAALPEDRADRALSQMTAEPYTNTSMLAGLANRQFIRRLYEPLRTIVTTNPCHRPTVCTCSQPFDLWFAASGGRSFIRGNHNARGFRAANYALCGGIQTTFNQTVTLGMAASYEKDSIGYRIGGSARNNITLGALYGLYRGRQFYALLDFLAGGSTGKVRRTVTVGEDEFRPYSTPRVYQTALYGEVGTDYGFSFLLLQPFLGIEWGYGRFHRIHEKDGAPLNVNVFKRTHDDAFSRLGVHLSSAPLRCGFTMGVDLAWIYRLTPLSNSIDVQFQEFGSPFKIKGLPFNRNSYEGIVRFTQVIFKRWELFFVGMAEGWEDSTAYSFVGGVKSTW